MNNFKHRRIYSARIFWKIVYHATISLFISLLLLSTLFWLAWFIPCLLYSFISDNFFFFFDRPREKKNEFSSIRPFIQKVARIRSGAIPGYVKNRMKKNPSVQWVLNEPLHYSIRSTPCNEINESKNKRNNISPTRWNN